jgi:adenylyltransferase/sulfurtransferase
MKGMEIREQKMIDRYTRHSLLRVIGPEGQEKIQHARVLVVGLGALGSTISVLLARAGVGYLRIVDGDAPELHNLHRQILYNEADVHEGLPKAHAAKKHLLEGNSTIVVEPYAEFVNAENVRPLLEGIDVVVDALDNIATRYLVNDCAVSMHIPYVFGGAVETVGNVMSIIPGRTACLRCLWPDPEAVKNHPTASTVGVLSAVASAVASIEVAECLKILVGSLDDLIPGLLVIELWANQYQIVALKPDPGCICAKVAHRDVPRP